MEINLDELENLSAKKITTDDLNNITTAVVKMNELKSNVDLLSEALADAKREYVEYSENIIPSMLDTVGISKFCMTDGRTVKIKTDYYPSIPNDNKEYVYSWLEDNGYNIINNQCIVDMNKKSKDAEGLLKALQEQGFPAFLKREVNSNTLKAQIKRIIESGIAVPEQINVHIIRKVVID